MRIKKHIAVALAGVLLISPGLRIQGTASAQEPKQSESVFLDPNRDPKEPAKAYQELWARQAAGKLTFDETMDMAMALLLQRQWEQAAGVYKAAAANVVDPRRKAAAITGAAQCLAAMHRWTEAGQLMNEANRLVPNSLAAVGLRYAFWSNAKDALEIRAAQDRMKQLNLGAEGNVVCEPGTILIVAIAAVTAPIITWIIVTKPSGEEMIKVGREHAKILREILALPLLGRTIGL